MLLEKFLALNHDGDLKAAVDWWVWDSTMVDMKILFESMIGIVWFFCGQQDMMLGLTAAAVAAPFVLEPGRARRHESYDPPGTSPRLP